MSNPYRSLADRLCLSYSSVGMTPDVVEGILQQVFTGADLAAVPPDRQEWLAQQFAKTAVPGDIRRAAEQLCSYYNIDGLCDPMYIANIIAHELGRGDGCSTFYAPAAPQPETPHTPIRTWDEVYKQLKADLTTEQRQWIEISEDMADKMLNVLPPIRHCSGYCYMTCEPYTHTVEGKGVYFTCLEDRSGRYWAIYATVAEWDSRTLVVGRNLPALQLHREVG